MDLPDQSNFDIHQWLWSSTNGFTLLRQFLKLLRKIGNLVVLLEIHKSIYSTWVILASTNGF